MMMMMKMMLKIDDTMLMSAIHDDDDAPSDELNSFLTKIISGRCSCCWWCGDL